MKVLVTRKIPRTAIELLRKHPDLELDVREGEPLSEQDLKLAVKDAAGIIPVSPDQITKDIIEAAGSSLKIISLYAVGYDNIDLKASTESGVFVANTPGDLTEAVAEFTLGLIFAVSKKIVVSDNYIRDGKYKFWDPLLFLGPTLMNKTIGIIGLGRIGTHLARMCKNGFNMRVIYFDENRNNMAETELGLIYTSLDELLEKSDFVSLHLPLLPSTTNIIGEREFRKMKPTAYIINTARGALINEHALCRALEEKWIEGAALDVFEDEPRFCESNDSYANLVVTPHIASATREARIEMARLAAQNIIDVLVDNKPPTNLVNKEILNK